MAQYTKDCRAEAKNVLPTLSPSLPPPPLLLGSHCYQFLVYPSGDILCIFCKEICISFFLRPKCWLAMNTVGAFFSCSDMSNRCISTHKALACAVSVAVYYSVGVDGPSWICLMACQ